MYGQGFLPGDEAEEELHLTPRPEPMWGDGMHSAAADLPHSLDEEPLFSNHHPNPSHGYHHPHHASGSHAALPHPHLGTGETAGSTRYVIFDDSGEIQEALGGQAQGDKKRAVPVETQDEASEFKVHAPLEQQGRDARIQEEHGTEVVGLPTTVDCKACMGLHVGHTCGVRGKRAVQLRSNKKPPAGPAVAAAAAKHKGEGGGAATASVGSKRELDVTSPTTTKKTLTSQGVRVDSKRPPLATLATASTSPLAAAPATSSRPNGRSPEHSPSKAPKASEGKSASSHRKAEQHVPAESPPPASPKPLPCCTYECCPNPLHTSGGWKRVTSETRAGARDWTLFKGRLFCNACFTQYATTGSMIRKGRPQQENPYLAGGPMQIPHEKPREERHERVHAGGMALRPSITQTNRIDLE